MIRLLRQGWREVFLDFPPTFLEVYVFTRFRRNHSELLRDSNVHPFTVLCDSKPAWTCSARFAVAPFHSVSVAPHQTYEHRLRHSCANSAWLFTIFSARLARCFSASRMNESGRLVASCECCTASVSIATPLSTASSPKALDIHDVLFSFLNRMQVAVSTHRVTSDASFCVSLRLMVCQAALILAATSPRHRASGYPSDVWKTIRRRRR